MSGHVPAAGRGVERATVHPAPELLHSAGHRHSVSRLLFATRVWITSTKSLPILHHNLQRKSHQLPSLVQITRHTMKDNSSCCRDGARSDERTPGSQQCYLIL
jgi:hypothetical protein